MSFVNYGTDPNSIAARLRRRYGNLTAPSSKNVTNIRKTVSKSLNSLSASGSEVNQQEERAAVLGMQTQLEGQQKFWYDLPEGYKKSSTVCICMRKHTAFECDRCHQYFYGRISEICEKHPHDFFLMDIRSCPYCKAPIEMIKKSQISWDAIRKIEEAELPSDYDL
ncbi:uncharacterized protein CG13380 [Drosophila eugracilis]|uniref:uncharacterized protein CG13380 n=1 Tax=Drosophila eugracilis TaxID=29029 RepID=UPI0007E89ED2|nr:uncharacterized protein CG13380 [Drosophila eugracilis]